LNQYNLSILDSLNDLYLVASPDVLSLFQVKKIVAELHKHNFPDERIHLILNRNVDYEDKLLAQEAQKMLGITAYFSLPNDYSGLTEAYASGNLLSEHSPLGHQISALASKVSGIASWERDEQRHEPWYRKFRVARGWIPKCWKCSYSNYKCQKERSMVYRNSLRRILRQLYQRKADVESLICFLEKQARRSSRRRMRSARLVNVAS